jgi:cephalosporin hydroxylase
MDHFFQKIEGWFDEDTDWPMYASMVDKYPSGSHFVEIGSWQGRSACCMAVEIINSDKDIKFDCVDTWRGSEEHQSDPRVVHDKLYSIFLENTKPVSHMIKDTRMPSCDASKLYEDNSLDFVFVDGDHTYEGVWSDLENWFPKLKVGGSIVGHDYGNGNFPGLKRAADEFSDKYNTPLAINRHLFTIEKKER